MVAANSGTASTFGVTPEMNDPVYEPEDCRVEHLGEIKLADGRVFQGAIVTFPVSPPKLPISVVWDGAPVRMTVKSTAAK